MFVLIFSTAVCETFLLVRRNERAMLVNVCRSSCTVPLICQILKKLDISQNIFEKYSSIEFHENSSSGSRVIPCGETDRETKEGSRLQLTVAFQKSVNALKVPRSAHTAYLCVLCGSENKQRLFPYTALNDWFV